MVEPAFALPEGSMTGYVKAVFSETSLSLMSRLDEIASAARTPAAAPADPSPDASEWKGSTTMSTFSSSAVRPGV